MQSKIIYLCTSKYLNQLAAMKQKLGKIGGFIVGLSSFLFSFKVFVLPSIPPNDEIAPGAVLIAAILNGFLFGFIGSLLQKYLQRNRV